MKKIRINEDWKFRRGQGDFGVPVTEDMYRTVELPHDYMIESEVSEDSPGKAASGFFTEGVAHYVKELLVPAEWEGDRIGLLFDGVMMNAMVQVNGDKAGLQHNGYFPFYLDITRQVYPGEKNEIRVLVNPSMQPNSRWYSGAGIIRDVFLCHGPALHFINDSIYAYTEEIVCGEKEDPAYALLSVEAEAVNETADTCIAEVTAELLGDKEDTVFASARQVIQINPGQKETAFLRMTADAPRLWSAEEPNLYRIRTRIRRLGIYKTHFIEEKEDAFDEDETLFGIRTVTADPRRGLRINGKTVKLKGGCLHHDNGILGAVSIPDVELRKIRKLKESGFNAIRTTHNPPSMALLTACDRLGMYVFDEAFDAWGMGKQPGDYQMFFDSDWERDLTAFLRRDRSHPAVILWSTGNEITERGGLNNGYTLSGRLTALVRSLDRTRPVSNGICSFWSGLDNALAEENRKKLMNLMNGEEGDDFQNADADRDDLGWERRTEPFANGLTVVGYNYLEDKYERDHELYPSRVMLGSENYPKEIGFRWPMVEKTPYVIGDFTWTAWDYIGEAGIGKTVFVEDGDPRLRMGPFALMSHNSEFPWRLANDADFDITGDLRPQGRYRRIVWGSRETALFSYDPAVYGKTEIISPWGFTDVKESWTFPGSEGKSVQALVFSGAEEVELFLNGRSIGKKRQGEAPGGENLPLSFLFDLTYEEGELTAVSYTGGKELSRRSLITTGRPDHLRITEEEPSRLPGDEEGPCVDEERLRYLWIETLDAEDRLVPDARIRLSLSLSGDARLLGFGSAAPVTYDNYSSRKATTFCGKAQAILKAKGAFSLKAEGEGIGTAEFG